MLVRSARMICFPDIGCRVSTAATWPRRASAQTLAQSRFRGLYEPRDHSQACSMPRAPPTKPFTLHIWLQGSRRPVRVELNFDACGRVDVTPLRMLRFCGISDRRSARRLGIFATRGRPNGRPIRQAGASHIAQRRETSRPYCGDGRDRPSCFSGHRRGSKPSIHGELTSAALPLLRAGGTSSPQISIICKG